MNEVRIRNYRESDLEPLVELINAAETVDQVERGTSLQELRERLSSPTLKPKENVFVAQAGGQVVGYVQLRLEKGEAESAFKTDGAVHPAWRRRGIGQRLLSQAYQRTQERLGVVTSEAVYFDAICEYRDAGRMVLFESFGMRPARYFLKMAYAPLEDVAEPRFPPGIAVRTWVWGQDTEAVWGVVNEAFAPVVRTYRTNCDHWGFVPVPWDEWLHWVNRSRFRPELNLLAVAGEEIAGLCLCDVNEEYMARVGRREGWVDTLAVRRPYRRWGLGRALLLAGLHVLKGAGMESATLGVDAESLTGAIRLYESVGFVERRRFILYRRPL